MRTISRPILLVGLAALAIPLTACKETTEGNHLSVSDDKIPPLFEDHSPDTSALGPFGVPFDQVTIVDTSLVNFVPPSGVDPASVTLTVNGQPVEVSHVGKVYQGPVGADGPKTVTWSAKDSAGNRSIASYKWTAENDSPGVAYSQTPASTIQASGATLSLVTSGTVSAPSIAVATETLLQPGSSGACGNADNTPVTVGTGLGQALGTNVVDFLPSVTVNGTFSGTVTISNAVPPGGQSVTRMYCPTFRFEDAAMTAKGKPAHHVTTRSFTVQVVWSAPPSLSVTATFHHVGNGNEVCVNIIGTPGASYAGTISGPGFGPATFAGSIGPSGAAIARISVPQLGTYSGSVSSGSRSATFSVDVTSAAGTCT